MVTIKIMGRKRIPKTNCVISTSSDDNGNAANDEVSSFNFVNINQFVHVLF